MIYIFDDNIYGQLSSNYRINYIDYFEEKSEYLIHIKSHNQYQLSDLLKTAHCVLIHHSFPDEIETGRIQANCKEQGIPLVIFSNQYTGTVFYDEKKMAISQIKKDRMYYNLMHFVDKYINSGEIHLDLLVLGKNYEVEKARIILDRLSLFLFIHQQDFYYNVYFTEKCNDSEKDKEKTNAWKDLKELFYMAIPEEDFDNIEEDLEQITVHELLQKIKSLVSLILEKHGYENNCN
mgnify:CR=1 FL=1